MECFSNIFSWPKHLGPIGSRPQISRTEISFLPLDKVGYRATLTKFIRQHFTIDQLLFLLLNRSSISLWMDKPDELFKLHPFRVKNHEKEFEHFLGEKTFQGPKCIKVQSHFEGRQRGIFCRC